MAWAGDSLGCQLYYFLSSWYTFKSFMVHRNIVYKGSKRFLKTQWFFFCHQAFRFGQLLGGGSPLPSPCQALHWIYFKVFKAFQAFTFEWPTQSYSTRLSLFMVNMIWYLAFINSWFPSLFLTSSGTLYLITQSLRLSECKTLLLLLTVASLVSALPELGVTTIIPILSKWSKI